MSYILDALKRSEQERHQDKVADLSQDLLILQRKQQKKSIWPLVVAGLLIVNVVVLFFLFYNDESIVTQPKKNESFVDKDISKTHKNSVIQSESTSVASQTNKPLVKSIPKHVQKQVVTERVGTNQVPKDESSKSKSNNAVFTEDGFELIAPKNTSKSDMARLAAGRAEDTNESASNEAGYEIIRPKNGTSELSNRNNTAMPPLNSGVDGSDYFDNIPHLTDLNLNVQKSVPNLTFNSHIYSDSPDARRVMINNLYMREGDAFSGLSIKSIGEQYIHLENDAGSFKLPVLRDWTSP